MKAKLIHDPYRNPFHNRFHVPVASRLDEMQTYTQMAWLNEQIKRDHNASQAERKTWGRAIAGAFAILLVVVFSAALISN